jgi:hypothetical protein
MLLSQMQSFEPLGLRIGGHIPTVSVEATP